MSNSLKRTYEAMFLVDTAIATTNWDDIIAEINSILQRRQADVVSIRKWDERRLAYDVAGRKRGTYILCYLLAPPASIGLIERDVQLNETLLRVLILQAEHMSEDDMNLPTPAMQREAAEARAAEASDSAGPVDEPAVAVADTDEDLADESAEDIAEPKARSEDATSAQTEDDEPEDDPDDETDEETDDIDKSV